MKFGKTHLLDLYSMFEALQGSLTAKHEIKKEEVEELIAIIEKLIKIEQIFTKFKTTRNKKVRENLITEFKQLVGSGPAIRRKLTNNRNNRNNENNRELSFTDLYIQIESLRQQIIALKTRNTLGEYRSYKVFKNITDDSVKDNIKTLMINFAVLLYTLTKKLKDALKFEELNDINKKYFTHKLKYYQPYFNNNGNNTQSKFNGSKAIKSFNKFNKFNLSDLRNYNSTRNDFKLNPMNESGNVIFRSQLMPIINDPHKVFLYMDTLFKLDDNQTVNDIDKIKFYVLYWFVANSSNRLFKLYDNSGNLLTTSDVALEKHEVNINEIKELYMKYTFDLYKKITKKELRSAEEIRRVSNLNLKLDSITSIKLFSANYFSGKFKNEKTSIHFNNITAYVMINSFTNTDYNGIDDAKKLLTSHARPPKITMNQLKPKLDALLNVLYSDDNRDKMRNIVYKLAIKFKK